MKVFLLISVVFNIALSIFIVNQAKNYKQTYKDNQRLLVIFNKQKVQEEILKSKGWDKATIETYMTRGCTNYIQFIEETK